MEADRVGVVPYRYQGGLVEVLLVTSRGGGRWIIPKGRIEAHLGPLESAVLEAYEEAGVRGAIQLPPLGSYVQDPEHGEQRIEVYLLRVTRELRSWPEERERQRRWMLIREALDLVDDDGIRPLLHMAAEQLH